MNHIDVLNNKMSCSGCTACMHSCHQRCITMQADDEGFLYPIVDEELQQNTSIIIQGSAVLREGVLPHFQILF